MTAGKPLDIIEVLLHYGVDVHPGRVEQLALCVSHSEDKPSMSVNSDKGLVNCHACDFSGDAWTVIMTKEGCDFAGAIEFARDITGFSPEPPGRAGLRGRTRPSRGGYRPSFKRRGLND